jgi:hypothetical protein
MLKIICSLFFIIAILFEIIQSNNSYITGCEKLEKMCHESSYFDNGQGLIACSIYKDHCFDNYKKCKNIDNEYKKILKKFNINPKHINSF